MTIMPFEIDEGKLSESQRQKSLKKLSFIERVVMWLFALGFFVIFWGGILLLIKFIF
jgi:hypothetical protein